MAILTAALAVLMILAGLGALAMSVDLIPTEVGLLYGVSGVILMSAAGIVLAVAALIARLDRIVAPRPEPAPADAAPEEEPTGLQEIGRYVFRGIEYTLYSDGAIEAETEEGPLHFASMAEFRGYLEARAGAEAD